MSWAKIDDLLPHHDKLIRAGAQAPAVFGLYVASICYAQRQRTDGRIPRMALATLLPGAPRPSRRLIRRLVTLRLWDLADDGWSIHDYLDHNLAKNERSAAQAANAARQARYRANLRMAGQMVESDAVSNASCNASVTGPTPLLSSPLHSSPLRSAVSNALREGFSTPDERPEPERPVRIGELLTRLRQATDADAGSSALPP